MGTENNKNKSLSRREVREQCFTILFEKTFTDDSIQDIIDNAVESRMLEIDKFTMRLLGSYEENSNAIDEIISQNIKGWKLSRLSRVTLSVLRLAVTEILYLNTPNSVVINEAVEISKIYAAPKEVPFINGVLGSVAATSEKKD